jgi:hypothetical protein
VIKKPRTRGGYSPTTGLQNTNPQWVVAPVEKKKVARIIKMFNAFPNNSDSVFFYNDARQSDTKTKN